MPYIKDEDKRRVTVTFGPKGCPQTAGELNYFLTMVVQRYLKQHGLSYQRFNDCIGALEGCKLELYRRIGAPYEDEKIKENGDVNLLSDA